MFLLSPGEFLSMVSRHAEACAAKVHAAELAPTDYALVVGAATALRLMDRKSEAEYWYRQVINEIVFCKSN